MQKNLAFTVVVRDIDYEYFSFAVWCEKGEDPRAAGFRKYFSGFELPENDDLAREYGYDNDLIDVAVFHGHPKPKSIG